MLNIESKDYLKQANIGVASITEKIIFTSSSHHFFKNTALHTELERLNSKIVILFIFNLDLIVYFYVGKNKELAGYFGSVP